MLSRNKRKSYYKNESSLKRFLKNYPLILLLLFFLFIIYSIIDYHYLSKELITDTRSYNSKQIRKFNLHELYNQKNLKHNEVRIWILNNTNQKGLAGKMRDCFEKGYSIIDEKIKGDYTVYKQDNFVKEDRYDLGKIDSDETKVFIHVNIEDNPQFKTHIQEFLNFSGLKENKLEYEFSTKLYEQRDITIILGDDWNVDNNLIYCDEPIN